MTREHDAAFTLITDWSLHPQGAYALWRFCNRIAAEGYIKDGRRKELLERAENSRDGHGFFTNAELKARSTSTDDLVKDLF